MRSLKLRPSTAGARAVQRARSRYFEIHASCYAGALGSLVVESTRLAFRAPSCSTPIASTRFANARSTNSTAS